MIRSGPTGSFGPDRAPSALSPRQDVEPSHRLRTVVCTSSEVTAFVVQGIVERLLEARVEIISVPRRSRQASEVADLVQRLDERECELLVLDVEPFGRGVLQWLEQLRGSERRLAAKVVLLLPVDFRSLSARSIAEVDLVLRKPLDVEQTTADLGQLVSSSSTRTSERSSTDRLEGAPFSGLPS